MGAPQYEIERFGSGTQNAALFLRVRRVPPPRTWKSSKRNTTSCCGGKRLVLVGSTTKSAYDTPCNPTVAARPDGAPRRVARVGTKSTCDTSTLDTSGFGNMMGLE